MKNYNFYKKFAVIVLFIALISAISCTDNQRAKNWGGKMTITLEANQKLVNATWKESDLWVLTRPMEPQEKAVNYLFSENSSWGIMSGQITIIEIKK